MEDQRPCPEHRDLQIGLRRYRGDQDHERDETYPPHGAVPQISLPYARRGDERRKCEVLAPRSEGRYPPDHMRFTMRLALAAALSWGGRARTLIVRPSAGS